MSDKLLWTYPFAVNETRADIAKRFVEAIFGVERNVRFDNNDTRLFWFYDSAWKYRMECADWVATVYRTNEPSPAGKARQKARRMQRPPSTAAGGPAGGGVTNAD